MYVHVKRFCFAGKTLESNIKTHIMPYLICNGHKQNWPILFVDDVLVSNITLYLLRNNLCDSVFPLIEIVGKHTRYTL